MAEIPTLQGVEPQVGRLAVRVGGRPAKLRLVRSVVAHPHGAAGLRTTRYQAILVGPRIAGPTPMSIVDGNYAGRIGWKEIVVGAHTRSASDELRAYPRDLLRSPLDVTTVRATIEPTDDPPPTLLTGRALAAPDRVEGSRYAALVERGDLGLLVVLTSLALAVFWARRTRSRRATGSRSSAPT